MKKIWKQVLDGNSKRDGIYPIHVSAPVDSKPISVGIQGPSICVWFECEPNNPTKEIAFTLYCVGTGHGVVPENCRFLGTVVVGQYVWHYYVEQ